MIKKVFVVFFSFWFCVVLIGMVEFGVYICKHSQYYNVTDSKCDGIIMAHDRIVNRTRNVHVGQIKVIQRVHRYLCPLKTYHGTYTSMLWSLFYSRACQLAEGYYGELKEECNQECVIKQKYTPNNSTLYTNNNKGLFF